MSNTIERAIDTHEWISDRAQEVQSLTDLGRDAEARVKSRELRRVLLILQPAIDTARDVIE